MSPCEKNSAVLEPTWEALIRSYKPVVRRQVTRSLRLAGVNRPRHEQIEDRERRSIFGWSPEGRGACGGSSAGTRGSG